MFIKTTAGWECECGELFSTRRKLYAHRKITHFIEGRGTNQYIKAQKLGLPKPQMSIEARKKISKAQTGKCISEEQRKIISKGMKKAHAEGRAWNIGKSRWNNEPSFPEQFFIKVIENEFIDKNYRREMPFDIYSLDFAWQHKKKCIEIDGQQHDRFNEVKKRDEKKNKLLAENGWSVLRIKWIDMFHNTKHWIKIAREFIDI